jgi:putative transposase
MKWHLPAGFWKMLFEDIEKHDINPELARRTLDLSKSTFYRKQRQHRAGGVPPRKPGSGRKRQYLPETYEPMIKEILVELPPIAGHKRIYRKMLRKGVPFSQSTAYKIMKDLNLLVPKRKGRSFKKFDKIEVDGSNILWLADTTEWWMGNQKMMIYLALDAHSRWIPYVMASSRKTKESTVRYYGRLFEKAKPKTIQTDNGTEFTNRNAIALLKELDVEWKHTPSHTPQANGLVERLVRTLKHEWLEWKEPKDFIELQDSLDEFTEWYNKTRDHSAIDYKVPEEVHYANIQ